jgi:restriction system protein
MSKPVSRSEQLIGAMHYQALKALSQAPNGQLHRDALLTEIEKNTSLDEWARTIYENGNTRWRSIFGFASVGLVKGGYVTKNKGSWSITDEGRAVIDKPYDGAAFVKEVRRRYRAWKNSQIISSSSSIDTTEDEEIEEPPKEHMARLIKSVHESLAAELIESIKQCDPEFFEQLVVQLLIKMGYGGSRQEAGRAVGQSGDGGIDGVINEDRLETLKEH